MPWNILVEDIDFAVETSLAVSRNKVYSSSQTLPSKSMPGLIAGQGMTSVRLELTGMDSQLGLGFFNSVPALYQVGLLSMHLDN